MQPEALGGGKGCGKNAHSRFLPPGLRSLLLVDGENLVLRYEAMKNGGFNPTESIIHIPNVFVWHPNLAGHMGDYDVVRVAYYTSKVGGEDEIIRIQNQISSVKYSPRGSGLNVFPSVFKKPAKSEKSKNVDIAITIDALRHTFQNHIDALFLYSGDGDYLPLIQEVMRQGKRVYLGALSSGCNPALKRSADSFIDLDKDLFLPQEHP